MEKKIVQENEKEEGGNETLSRGEIESHPHTGPAGVGNDSTTPNSTTGDTTHAGAFMQCLWVLPSDGHAFAAPRVLLTQAMRSRRVSSASKLPDTPDPVSVMLGLRTWF
jgi:hypothetical protein